MERARDLHLNPLPGDWEPQVSVSLTLTAQGWWSSCGAIELDVWGPGWVAGILMRPLWRAATVKVVMGLSKRHSRQQWQRWGQNSIFTEKQTVCLNFETEWACVRIRGLERKGCRPYGSTCWFGDIGRLPVPAVTWCAVAELYLIRLYWQQPNEIATRKSYSLPSP